MIRDIFKRIRNNRRYIWKKSISNTALVYAILGFVGVFVTLEGIFNPDTSFICKLLISVLILLVIGLLNVFAVCFRIFRVNKKKVVEGQNGKAVYVIYGDLFSEDIVPKGTRRSICFAVNRCFDTIVNNHLIASTSVHGTAFKRLYSSNIFTPDSLNDIIQQRLSSEKWTLLTEKKKPQGNLKRYNVGTSVDIPVSSDLNYFLVGLTTLNYELKAETTLEEYCMGIQKMIEFINAHAQGQPVLMPVIGSFLARTGLSTDEHLRYIINCFKFNHRSIYHDVYIVVRESDKISVPILDL